MGHLTISRLLIVMIIASSNFDVSYGGSSYLQLSHASGYSLRKPNIRTSMTLVDRYEEINSGRVNLLDSYVSTSSRYHGPNPEPGVDGNRFRRDTSPPEGAVFATFNQYVPFGKTEPIPIATFTDGDFDFDSGVFTAPYSGAFFFLFHGPYGNEPDSVAVSLGSQNVDGINSTHVDLNVTEGVSGVLPVVLPLKPGETAYIELEEYPRMRVKFSAVFNIFDLYHFNVPPTQQYFTPYRIRQSAFTAFWRDDLPLTARDEFIVQGNYRLTINLGSNFDIGTGIFTAQFPGLYAFFLSFRVSDTPGSTTISIRRNEVKVVSVGASVPTSTTMDRVSTAIVLKLDAGDKIQLVKEAFTPEVFEVGDALLVFTGFLL